MKRLITLLICALSCTGAFAQNPLMEVKSGSLDIFKDSVSINVVIEDYNALIDGRNQYAKEYFTAQSQQTYLEFCDDLMRGHESFISYYNIEKGRLNSVMVKSNDAPYTLQVDVSLMNVGNSARAIIGLSHKSGGAMIYGTMKLIDNASGEVKCEITFNGIKGMRSPIFRGRAISVYRYLADALIGTIR